MSRDLETLTIECKIMCRIEKKKKNNIRIESYG